eukprot:COSAG01_NODE_2639_length_7326_cov_15.912550_1_plen_113_part_10
MKPPPAARPGAIVSAYRGVTRNKRRQKWQAQISVKGVTMFLGYFDDVPGHAQQHGLLCTLGGQLHASERLRGGLWWSTGHGGDCGDIIPCGWYQWDHRNESLRTWIVNEFVLG